MKKCSRATIELKNWCQNCVVLLKRRTKSWSFAGISKVNPDLFGWFGLIFIRRNFYVEQSCRGYMDVSIKAESLAGKRQTRYKAWHKGTPGSLTASPRNRSAEVVASSLFPLFFFLSLMHTRTHTYISFVTVKASTGWFTLGVDVVVSEVISKTRNERTKNKELLYVVTIGNKMNK